MPAVFFNGKLSYLNERRNLFVLLTSLFFLIDLSLFNKKWLAGRQYPNVPVFQFLTDIAPFWHELLFFFCILGTLFVIALPKKGSKFALSFLMIAITVSCALDIVRMQGPTLIALVGLLLLTIDDDIAPVQLMFVLFYFWVGFQKLNYNFITYGFANMFKNQPWFSVMQPYLGYIGAVGALCEMAVGLLLFFSSSRRMGLWLMVFVHGIILIMLSPVILNEDSYVWPYNIWLAAAVAVLFYKTENETTFFNLRPATMIVVLFFLVAPAANVFGHWDENLSFKFYSFNLRSAAIRFEDGSAWLNH
ncbi:MAG: hypothetical protein K0R29_2441, partial [Pseudobdellovibrio sp.]|nr:hypothetical protein [Pseudobdellovibrio sp.]